MVSQHHVLRTYPSGPVMTFLWHSWPFTPFWAMSSGHPGDMLPERLFGPTVNVFFVSRTFSRFGSGTRSTAAGAPSKLLTEAK